MQNLVVALPEKMAALKRSSYFAHLSPAVLDELAGGAYLRRYEAGESVCWQEDACAGLYMIQSGSVKLFKISPKGRELIIRILEDGATFNEVPVFDGGTNVVNVAALTAANIWLVEREVIAAAMRRHPEMAEAVIQNLSQNLRRLVGMVEELSFYQVTHRLARLLYDLPPEQLSGPPAQRITQDQMAARLGTVREVVARSLRELERSGAIRTIRRQIHVVDRDRLRAWVQEG